MKKTKRYLALMMIIVLILNLSSILVSAEDSELESQPGFLLSKRSVEWLSEEIFPGEAFDFTTQEYQYDETGKLIKATYTDPDGTASSTTYTYDSAGRLLSENTEGGYNITYTYNEKGNETSEVIHDNPTAGYNDSTITTYDVLDRVINIEHSYYMYDQFSSAFVKQTKTKTFIYDGNSENPSEMDEKETAEGSTYISETKTVYTYDANGNLLTETSTNKWGTTSITYDGKGNILSEVNDMYENTYTYDQAGRCLTHVKRSKSGDEVSTTRNTYDDHGNLASTSLDFVASYDQYSYTDEYRNEYDSYGNLIKRTTIEGGEETYSVYYEYIRLGQTGENKPDSSVPSAKPGAFTDVSENDYYYDAVQWAIGKDITTGTTETTFGPGNPCTRAQAVTFLWRAEGCPAPKGSTNKFTDVPAGQYYSSAVAWAVENGIVNGTSDTEFSPNLTCNRAQIVTMLYRLAGSLVTQGTVNFTDVPSGQYYFAAVQWAVSISITTGTTATTFGPNDTCIRAQIVTFLYRYYNPSSVTPAPAPGGNTSDSSKIADLSSYAGITVNELRNRLGDFCLEEYWYLGAAKGIYYDKKNADGSFYYPIYFYYIDEDYTSNPRGDEIIDSIQYYPDSNDGVVEVAPGISKNLTATELLSMGGEYQVYDGYLLEDWCRYMGTLTVGKYWITFYFEDLVTPAGEIDIGVETEM